MSGDLYRDLVSRLGFGDNITEPMADNDTIVAWFEQQSRDASEWQEANLWRTDCYLKGHPEDDDCFECDPLFAECRGRVKALREVAADMVWDFEDHPVTRSAVRQWLNERADEVTP